MYKHIIKNSQEPQLLTNIISLLGNVNVVVFPRICVSFNQPIFLNGYVNDWIRTPYTSGKAYRICVKYSVKSCVQIVLDLIP